MLQLICCDILSAVILFLLAATLVINEHDNRKISHFILCVLLALMSVSMSVYGNTVISAGIKSGTDPSAAVIGPFFDFLVDLCEALSLSFFSLFLKAGIFKGTARHEHLVTALSFASVPLTAAAFAFPGMLSYPSVFLFQAILIILFAAFFGTEQNVRTWFITAGAVYAVTCIAGIISEETASERIGLMLMYLIVFIGYEVQLKNEVLRRELELSEAKNALLMRQISPHFIFNSLQVIIGMCDRSPENVKPALTHFSEYLRNNLESVTSNDLIPFEKELAHTKEYLALEQYGDGKKFTVEYRLDATDFRVPPLVLQPVVENAVQYGIGTRTHGGNIVIETADTPFMTLIRVKDDGTGKSSITEQQKTRRSIGMQNVRARLKALCGGELIFESSENGTTVTLTIPKNDSNKM